MEVVVTTGAVRCAKLQSKCHHQQTNTQFTTGQMPLVSPTNRVKALMGKVLRFTDSYTYSLSILTAIFQVNLV